MASADLRKELDCCVCLSTYTDPVNLRCGHNFCRVCIDRVLDTQKGFEHYSCPQCREKFQERPALQRNVTLCNIVENLWSIQAGHQEVGNFCTYCIHFLVPAVKSCLMCEAFLCYDHLKVHSRSPEHVLAEAITSTENRRCSFHKELLKYYYSENDVYICVSCSFSGEHQENQLKTPNEAFKTKKKLINVLQELVAEREETERRIQSLQERRRKVQEKADGESERVTAQIRDLRRQLEDLEKRVLCDISRHTQRVLFVYDDVIQQLEMKKEELSMKMNQIEELYQMTDPLTDLQKPDLSDLCDRDHYKQLHDGGDLHVAHISHTLYTGVSDILKAVNGVIYIQQAADILLDVKTAHQKLHISNDKRTATRKDAVQNDKERARRFENYPQVLSRKKFSSGRHYWEVDVGGSRSWRIGMCYPSIGRKGLLDSVIGWNKKFWGLDRTGNTYSVRHGGKDLQ